MTGSSRLGKAALLAGARDERFAVVAPNQTGGGGAPLAKRFFGENVSTETKIFPHWYCPAYRRYAENEAEMPFDQHWLLACVAPRALLVQGFDPASAMSAAAGTTASRPTTGPGRSTSPSARSSAPGRRCELQGRCPL